MNLQLVKIKRQNAFDYSLLSEFMKKKNGKLIFTAGFGNAGKITDNTQKTKLNLMQKFERNFQFQSIIKSYNEAFHIHPKQNKNNWTPENNKKINQGYYLPKIKKNKENLKLKYMELSRRTNYNQFKKNKNILKNSSILFRPNISLYGKNTSSYFRNNDNTTFDNNGETSVDYNNYFYNTIEYFPQGNNSYKENDFYNNIHKASSTTNFFNSDKINKKKLLRNISQDCIYLFGQNKIIYKNSKDKSRNNKDNIALNSEIQKTPFIDYNNEFNPYKTKYKLKKNFKFYKDKTKAYENFSEMRQEYIFKIRKMFENKKNVKYQFEFLPSHNTVKTMVRKNKIFDLVK